MQPNPLQPADFAKLLPFIVDRDTSSDPTRWSKDNPLHGHCAVVSLVAQNLFGGDILWASLAGDPTWGYMRSHYWNRFPDGAEFDFTREQFAGDFPTNLPAEARSREEIFGRIGQGVYTILGRYKNLAFRLARIVADDAPIFGDDIFRECFNQAITSPCQKMKFGCVVRDHRRRSVAQGHNEPLPPISAWCQPTCVRLSLPHRSDALIGACEHAEEMAVWQAVHQGFRMEKTNLHVVGLYPNGLVWFRDRPEFTCMRCAVLIYNARIKDVSVPMAHGWERIDCETALRTASLYASTQSFV